MSHRLTSAIKKNDKEVPITKIRPGVFALREWEEKKGKKGAAAAAAEPVADDAENEGGVEVNALEIEAQLRGAASQEAADRADEDDGDDEADEPVTAVSGEDALRADLAASGADLFDDEDDDDQPILAPLSQPGAPAAQGEVRAQEAPSQASRPRGQRTGRAPGRRFHGRRGRAARRRATGRRARSRRATGSRSALERSRRSRGSWRPRGPGLLPRSHGSTPRRRARPSPTTTASKDATRRARRVRSCATASRSWRAGSRRASTSRSAKAKSSSAAISRTRRPWCSLPSTATRGRRRYAPSPTRSSGEAACRATPRWPWRRRERRYAPTTCAAPQRGSGRAFASRATGAWRSPTGRSAASCRGSSRTCSRRSSAIARPRGAPSCGGSRSCRGTRSSSSSS